MKLMQVLTVVMLVTKNLVCARGFINLGHSTHGAWSIYRRTNMKSYRLQWPDQTAIVHDLIYPQWRCIKF